MSLTETNRITHWRGNIYFGIEKTRALIKSGLHETWMDEMSFKTDLSSYKTDFYSLDEIEIKEALKNYLPDELCEKVLVLHERKLLK